MHSQASAGVFIHNHHQLKVGVLGFQLLQSLGLVHLDAAVFLAPASVGLLADTRLFTGLGDSLVLCQQYIRFTELLNDLFGVVSFLWHGSDLINWLVTTVDLCQEGRAKSW